MIKKSNKSKYAQKYISSLSAEDRHLVGLFVDEFRATHTYNDFELRLSSKEVKDFLSRHQSSISFTKFNRMTGCSGITSNNLYSYELVLLLTLKEVVVEIEHKKSYTGNKIFTINGYGSKRFLSEEWKALLHYVSDNLGCKDLLIDAFAGTGYISLEAAKQKVFNHIIQNDASTELYNYYSVMKDERKYADFRNYLEMLPQPSKEALALIRDNFYYKVKNDGRTKEFAGLEKKRQLQTVDAKRAAYLFVLRHFTMRGVGSMDENKKAIKHYLDALDNTHELYKDIEVSNLLYQNAIRDHLNDRNCLIVLDAPYPEQVRTQKKSYSVEFNTLRQHGEMLEHVMDCDAKVIICGYYNSSISFYNKYLLDSVNTWHCLRIKQKSKTGLKHEHVWMNFEIDELVGNTGLFEKIY